MKSARAASKPLRSGHWTRRMALFFTVLPSGPQIVTDTEAMPTLARKVNRPFSRIDPVVCILVPGLECAFSRDQECSVRHSINDVVDADAIRERCGAFWILGAIGPFPGVADIGIV